jgi:hypothetical protein
MPGLKPVDRKGVFYAVGTVGCQRIRKSLGTRDKRQAAELCAQYEAILWKRRSYGEEAVRTFEEAAVSYMEAGGERTYIRPLISRFRGRLLGTRNRLGWCSKSTPTRRPQVGPWLTVSTQI